MDRTEMVAHDKELVRLWKVEQVKQTVVRNALREHTDNAEWADHARERGDDESFEHALKALERSKVKLQAARQALQDATQATQQHEQGYQGWSRFWHVSNSNGHTHRTRSCQTCFSSTVFGFVPDLSGMTEAELVATIGETACTVCFPTAPTLQGFQDGTSALARMDAAAKAEKAAEKAAKAAEKAAKGITQPDGNPLRELRFRSTEPGTGSVIKTLVTAKRELNGCIKTGWLNECPNVDYQQANRAQARYLAEAIAHKLGTTPEAVLAEHTQKMEKQKARDARECARIAKEMGR